MNSQFGSQSNQLANTFASQEVKTKAQSPKVLLQNGESLPVRIVKDADKLFASNSNAYGAGSFRKIVSKIKKPTEKQALEGMGPRQHLSGSDKTRASSLFDILFNARRKNESYVFSPVFQMAGIPDEIAQFITIKFGSAMSLLEQHAIYIAARHALEVSFKPNDINSDNEGKLSLADPNGMINTFAINKRINVNKNGKNVLDYPAQDYAAFYNFFIYALDNPEGLKARILDLFRKQYSADISQMNSNIMTLEDFYKSHSDINNFFARTVLGTFGPAGTQAQSINVFIRAVLNATTIQKTKNEFLNELVEQKQFPKKKLLTLENMYSILASLGELSFEPNINEKTLNLSAPDVSSYRSLSFTRETKKGANSDNYAIGSIGEQGTGTLASKIEKALAFYLDPAGSTLKELVKGDKYIDFSKFPGTSKAPRAGLSLAKKTNASVRLTNMTPINYLDSTGSAINKGNFLVSVLGYKEGNPKEGGFNANAFKELITVLHESFGLSINNFNTPQSVIQQGFVPQQLPQQAFIQQVPQPVEIQQKNVSSLSLSPAVQPTLNQSFNSTNFSTAQEITSNPNPSSTHTSTRSDFGLAPVDTEIPSGFQMVQEPRVLSSSRQSSPTRRHGQTTGGSPIRGGQQSFNSQASFAQQSGTGTTLPTSRGNSPSRSSIASNDTF